MLFPQIETERLILRTYRPDDLATVYDLCSDPHVTRFFHESYTVDRADILASLPRRRKRWQTQGFGQLGVFEKSAERLIGFCGLQFLDETTEVEIYYGFFKDVWGRGFATEAANAVLRFGFENVNLEQIVAATHHENIASHKVLHKIGMTRSETEREIYGIKAVFFSLSRANFKLIFEAYKLDYEEISDEELNV